MKRKLMLLGAACALFGTLAIGGGLSFTPSTDLDVIGNTGVIAPANASTTLLNHVASIAANNAYHTVDDINVGETDPNYNYILTKLEITNQGNGTANCGAHDYKMQTYGTVSPALTTAVAEPGPALVEYLQLRINPSGTDATCVISGGTLTSTFDIAP